MKIKQDIFEARSAAYAQNAEKWNDDVGAIGAHRTFECERPAFKVTRKLKAIGARAYYLF